ncbi:transporter substrate-binding domain-containing protein [bacterium]|nr:transporter substrate-binding domain-containing protein [bacterium]
MKKIFSIFLTVLFVVLTTTACVNLEKEQSTLEKIKSRDKLIVGVKTDSKPFGYKNEQGEIVGYDVDIAKKIAEDILGDSSKIELVEVTSSNRIMKLTSGEIDLLISSMTINSQRRKAVNFSMPYYATGQALMIRKGDVIKSFADLEDKAIGVVIGTTSEQTIKEFAPRATIKTVQTYKELYNLLKNGEVDVITSDAAILRGFEMDDAKVLLLPGRYTKEYYGIAFRKDETSFSLENQVNELLKKLSNSNFFDELSKTWKSE